jgi:proline iminopeptidase
MLEEARHVDVANARLWSVRQGQGPALAMLHGGPGMADYLGPVAAMLADIATVYRYDQRGCGRSPGGPPYDLATAVADLDAVRTAWGVERWTLLGHSWGATLALVYAVEHPERANGLIYVSGTGVDPAWHDAYRAERRARIPPSQRARWDELRALRRTATGAELERVEREYALLYAGTDLADPSRAPEVVAWLLVGGFPVNQQVNQELGADASRVVETPAFAARLRDLRVPTLVLHGEVDPRPARFAAQVAALIPSADLVVLPNVGHFPRFEDPEGFGRAVRGFLEQIGQGGR